MMFNGKIYDQIKSGNFDQGKIREFHSTFKMGTLVIIIKTFVDMNALQSPKFTQSIFFWTPSDGLS